MGNELGIPLLDSYTQTQLHGRLWAASCETQGYRAAMEDACIFAHPLLTSEAHQQKYPGTTTSVFGVCDGHGSDSVANWLKQQLPSFLSRLPDLHSYNTLQEAIVSLDYALVREQLAFKAQLKLDERSEGERLGGSTLLLAIVTLKNTPVATYPAVSSVASSAAAETMQVTVVNLGDGRALAIYPQDEELPLVQVTVDHKPDLPCEKQRVTKAGSFVSQGRIDGNLNLSRAMGDCGDKDRPEVAFHEQPITSVPDIYSLTDMFHPGNFLLLACDGYFEKSEQNEDVVKHLLAEWQAGTGQVGIAKPSSVGDCMKTTLMSLTRHSIEKAQSGDNHTAILLYFAPEPAPDAQDLIQTYNRAEDQKSGETSQYAQQQTQGARRSFQQRCDVPVDAIAEEEKKDDYLRDDEDKPIVPIVWKTDSKLVVPLTPPFSLESVTQWMDTSTAQCKLLQQQKEVREEFDRYNAEFAMATERALERKRKKMASDSEETH